jgi:DNA-binding NarL/FixJ family response regulator
MPRTVLLVDDSAAFRATARAVLEARGYVVVAVAEDGAGGLASARELHPDAALLDVNLPDIDGIGVARELTARDGAPAVVLVSTMDAVTLGGAIQSCGARGFVNKDSAEGVGYLLKDRVADFANFADAVRRVAKGGSALDPTVVSRMLGRRRRDDPLEQLTPREREVLELMAEGRSNRGIAEVLVVTSNAVEKHVTSIFSKLGVGEAQEDHRRVLAVLTFLRA